MEVVILGIAYNHKDDDDVGKGWKNRVSWKHMPALCLQVIETHERERDFPRSSDVDISQITPSAGVLELDL